MRSLERDEFFQQFIPMKPPAAIFVLLLLAACSAIPRSEPEVKRAEPPPTEIHIHTAPAGAVVDWNGNVLGTAPIVISLTPYFSPYSSHYSWPSNGVRTQRFRARWPDGAINTEFFDSNTPPPQTIAIISPSIGNYRHLWTAPAKKELQIKKGP
jgi:hypothetical protein